MVPASSLQWKMDVLEHLIRCEWALPDLGGAGRSQITSQPHKKHWSPTCWHFQNYLGQ